MRLQQMITFKQVQPRNKCIVSDFCGNNRKTNVVPKFNVKQGSEI